MSHLGYALDALYSVGWWPGADDRCIQSNDHRWMPQHERILESFSDAGYQIRITACDQTERCRVEWSRWGGVRGSATGRCRTEALLLAYTELIRTAPAAPSRAPA